MSTQIGVALRPRVRSTLAGDAMALVVLLWLYDLARGHAAVRASVAYGHGRQLLAAERRLHLDVELVLNAWTGRHGVAAMLLGEWYQWAHISVTMAVLAWCWLRRPDVYRWGRNALVLVNGVALVVFLAVPVAPPRLLPGSGFLDIVALGGYGPSSGPVLADQYGAMPSLHVAWALWTSVVACRLVQRRSARLLWRALPVVTTVVVVATGNHYLLDVGAGAVLATAALLVVRLAEARAPALR